MMNYCGLLKTKQLIVKKNIIVFIFFATYLGIGLAVYSDYGISWDEPQSRMNGEVNFKYVSEKLAPSWAAGKFNNTPKLHEWMDKDYGVAFELPLYAIEKIVKPRDERDIFLLRHLITFLYSSIGAWFLYKIICLRYKDWRLGLLAASFLVLSPRVFGDSFYNSKDLVFMVAFLVATYTLYAFILQANLRNALMHSFATAFATDIRIAACSIVLLTCGALLIQICSTKKKFEVVKFHALYIIMTAGFIDLMFPWLWESPVENFASALKNMTNFRWNLDLLYLGGRVNSQNLPWHYIAVWIFITAPLFILVLFILGIFSNFKNLITTLIKNKKFTNDEIFDGVILAVLFGFILSGIVFNSTFYDGWRQMYFIYPSFLIIAIGGVRLFFHVLSKSKTLTVAGIVGILCALLWSVGILYRMHPLQNLYFNQLAGSNWRNHFDIDYWGLANRSALQYILDRDSSPIISVTTDSATPLGLSLTMLRATERSRLNIVESEKPAKYLITNYRMINAQDQKYLTTHTIFYQIRLLGETVLTIFKMRD